MKVKQGDKLDMLDKVGIGRCEMLYLRHRGCDNLYHEEERQQSTALARFSASEGRSSVLLRWRSYVGIGARDGSCLRPPACRKAMVHIAICGFKGEAASERTRHRGTELSVSTTRGCVLHSRSTIEGVSP